jgi:hypothetical protein
VSIKRHVIIPIWYPAFIYATTLGSLTYLLTYSSKLMIHGNGSPFLLLLLLVFCHMSYFCNNHWSAPLSRFTNIVRSTNRYMIDWLIDWFLISVKVSCSSLCLNWLVIIDCLNNVLKSLNPGRPQSKWLAPIGINTATLAITLNPGFLDITHYYWLLNNVVLHIIHSYHTAKCLAADHLLTE